MCYFDVILLSDVISSIGPKISDADIFIQLLFLSEFVFTILEAKQLQKHVLSGMLPHISCKCCSSH